MRETQVQTLAWGDPLEDETTTHWYTCLKNSTDGGAWRATAPRVAKSQTQFSN